MKRKTKMPKRNNKLLDRKRTSYPTKSVDEIRAYQKFLNSIKE